MTFEEFHIGMKRLEKMFNASVEIGDELRQEYYDSFQYVRSIVFRDAVQLIIDTFRPFPLEPFPAISTIESAIMETRDQASDEAGWETRRQRGGDARPSDYCQKCGNLGIYLDEE